MAQPSHREQLIEGAMECLQTKGYSRTTARDIATASEANLASIGYHFGSKDALLNEALIRTLEQRNRHMGRVTRTSADGSSAASLKAFLLAANTVFKAPRPLFVAFVEAIVEAQHSDELRHRMTALYSDTRRGLESIIMASIGERSDALSSDPGTMAWVLLAVLDGLVLQWLLENDVPSGEELVAALTDMATLLKQAPSDGEPDTRRRKSRRTKSRSTKRQATRAVHE
jgi:AcrR family transcriptional regulator